MAGFLRPHTPWHVPLKYLGMYDPKSLTIPPYREDDFDDVPEAVHGILNKGYPRTEWALEKDPNEWTNLAENAEHAEVLKTMREKLAKYHVD